MTSTDPAPAVVGPPTRGAIRGLRVTALGGASLVLAAAAHVTGGGQLPSAGVLAMTALLLGLAAVTLTARRCRFRVLMTVLVVQQTLLHLLFDTASKVGPGCGVTPMAGMDHAAHVAVQVCDPSTMTSMASAGQLPGWAMWAAHLVATALTAGLLARGEAWLWRVADQIVHAANVAPGARPEPEAARRVPGRPAVSAEHRGHSPAGPRAPPQVLAVI